MIIGDIFSSEIGSSCVCQTCLACSSCLSFPSASIPGMPHHAQPESVSRIRSGENEFQRYLNFCSF
jgi:hypothetical protein